MVGLWLGYQLYACAPSTPPAQQLSLNDSTLIANADTLPEAFSGMEMYKKRHAHPTAKYIPQGQMGYTDADHGMIGTDNVNQCVWLALHDPASTRTGGIHIDNGMDIPRSLNVFLEGMQHGGNPLQARILGARYFGNKENEQLSQISAQNLISVLQWLRKHPEITLVSADINRFNQPLNMVLDTKSFAAAALVPETPYTDELPRNIRLANAASNVIPKGKLPVLAYDLTQNHTSPPPIFLSAGAIENLTAWYDETGGKVRVDIDSPDKPELHQAFEGALQSVVTKILRDMGNPNLSEEGTMHLRASIVQNGLYVGDGAEVANHAFLDAVLEEKPFTVKGGKLITDFDKLAQCKHAAELPIECRTMNFQQKTQRVSRARQR